MSRPSPPTGLLAIALLAAGCTGTISGPASTARPGDNAPTERISVMLAPPGSAGEAASEAVSKRVVAVLQQTNGDVMLIPTADDMQALAAAREAQAAYLISPTILEWEDGHAPPFTADHVKVRLDLRDPSSGIVVSSVTFSNVSGFFTVFDTGPEALLDTSFDRAVTLLAATASAEQAGARRARPSALEHVPIDQQKFPRQ